MPSHEWDRWRDVTRPHVLQHSSRLDSFRWPVSCAAHWQASWHTPPLAHWSAQASGFHYTSLARSLLLYVTTDELRWSGLQPIMLVNEEASFSLSCANLGGQHRLLFTIFIFPAELGAARCSAVCATGCWDGGADGDGCALSSRSMLVPDLVMNPTVDGL